MRIYSLIFTWHIKICNDKIYRMIINIFVYYQHQCIAPECFYTVLILVIIVIVILGISFLLWTNFCKWKTHLDFKQNDFISPSSWNDKLTENRILGSSLFLTHTLKLSLLSFFLFLFFRSLGWVHFISDMGCSKYAKRNLKHHLRGSSPHHYLLSLEIAEKVAFISPYHPLPALWDSDCIVLCPLLPLWKV